MNKYDGHTYYVMMVGTDRVIRGLPLLFGNLSSGFGAAMSPEEKRAAHAPARFLALLPVPLTLSEDGKRGGAGMQRRGHGKAWKQQGQVTRLAGGRGPCSMPSHSLTESPGRGRRKPGRPCVPRSANCRDL